jgi:hypothetical protein
MNQVILIFHGRKLSIPAHVQTLISIPKLLIVHVYKVPSGLNIFYNLSFHAPVLCLAPTGCQESRYPEVRVDNVVHSRNESQEYKSLT